jgi:hypothetical protein
MDGLKYIEWKREVEDAFLNILGLDSREAIAGTILFNYYKNGYEPAQVVLEISEKLDAYGFY